MFKCAYGVHFLRIYIVVINVRMDKNLFKVSKITFGQRSSDRSFSDFEQVFSTGWALRDDCSNVEESAQNLKPDSIF